MKILKVESFWVKCQWRRDLSHLVITHHPNNKERCLCVHLSVCQVRISQKNLHRFGWNFVCVMYTRPFEAVDHEQASGGAWGWQEKRAGGIARDLASSCRRQHTVSVKIYKLASYIKLLQRKIPSAASFYVKDHSLSGKVTKCLKSNSVF